jgi:hypothetical protein
MSVSTKLIMARRPKWVLNVGRIRILFIVYCLMDASDTAPTRGILLLINVPVRYNCILTNSFTRLIYIKHTI